MISTRCSLVPEIIFDSCYNAWLARLMAVMLMVGQMRYTCCSRRRTTLVWELILATNLNWVTLLLKLTILMVLHVRKRKVAAIILDDLRLLHEMVSIVNCSSLCCKFLLLSCLIVHSVVWSTLNRVTSLTHGSISGILTHWRLLLIFLGWKTVFVFTVTVFVAVVPCLTIGRSIRDIFVHSCLVGTEVSKWRRLVY